MIGLLDERYYNIVDIAIVGKFEMWLCLSFRL